MAPDTAIRPAPVQQRWRLPFPWSWVLGAVAIALFLIVGSRVVAMPSAVARLSVVNHTPYAIDVQVTGGRGDGWMDVNTAEAEATTVSADVIDQGSTWTFRFECQGAFGGELTINRADLARAGWLVVIPQTVGNVLARQGTSANPTPNT